MGPFGLGAAGGARIAPEVERALREEVWEVVGKLLDERRLLAPRPEDEDLIRGAVRERVVAYQRRAAAAGEPLLPQPERLEQRLFDRLLRLGPLEPLMRLEGVEEILVNGPWRVLCVQDGRKRLVPEIQFEDDEELRALVKRIVGPLGKRLDEGSPMVDVRLPDGSRLHAVIPPAASRWTCVTIRRFVLRAHSLDELVALDTLSPAAAGFLDAAVQAGVNIVVSGGTAGGKTTLVNALGASIASDQERICTVEDTPELTLDRILPDCVALQARPGNVEGAGEIRIRDLVRNALRMRPSRIVVGEVRGPEALDMLQAMNTGHEGSLVDLGAALRHGIRVWAPGDRQHRTADARRPNVLRRRADSPRLGPLRPAPQRGDDDRGRSPGVRRPAGRHAARDRRPLPRRPGRLAGNLRTESREGPPTGRTDAHPPRPHLARSAARATLGRSRAREPGRGPAGRRRGYPARRRRGGLS
jgi:pilus assembly protein CpaF